MALVKLPEGTQISGSIGGTTYSHNRYGAYKRNRSIPVNTNTKRQVDVRNLVRSLTIGWQNDLSQPQRDAWELYAKKVVWPGKLGGDVYLTGLNHYVRSNVPRQLAGVARIDAAPGIWNLAAAEPHLYGGGTEESQLVTMFWDDGGAWLTETGGFQIFWMGIPCNESIKFFNGPWRIAGAELGADAGKATTAKDKKDEAKPAAGTKVLVAKRGEGQQTYPAPWPLVEGNKIWVRSRIGRADGRLSEFAQHIFLCEDGAPAAGVGGH